MRDDVKTFIEKSEGKFTEADADHLDKLPADVLAKFAKTPAPAPAPVAPAAVPAPVPVPVPAPVAAAAAPAPAEPVTAEKWLETAPAEVRDIVSCHRTAETQRRTELVTALKTAQTEYKEEELKKMSLKDLERMLRALGSAVPASATPVDYSGAGVPRVSSAKSLESFAAPDPWKSRTAKGDAATK